MDKKNFKVYVIGYKNPKNKNTDYIKTILKAHNFDLCEHVEISDFILDTGEFSNEEENRKVLAYAEMDYIEVARNLHDLLKLREQAKLYEYQEV